MKTVLIAAIIAAGVFSVGVARADMEAATKAGCTKCHDLDKKKKGPPFKESAQKYKGDADAMYKAMTDPKGDHPELKNSPDEIKAVLGWVKTL